MMKTLMKNINDFFTPQEEKDEVGNEGTRNAYAEGEGITHINMKPTSTTRLGKLLAIETPNYFNHPVFGKFAGMEAYWYFIRSGARADDARYVDNNNGRKRFQGAVEYVPNFWPVITEGVYYMLKAMKEEDLALVLANELPLDQYYIHYSYNDEGVVIAAVRVRPRIHSQLVAAYTRAIELIREDQPFPPVDYGQLLINASSAM